MAQALTSTGDFEELAELTSLPTPHLNSEPDHWECLAVQTGSFIVKCMRDLISNSSIVDSSWPSRWNNLVPKKVNIASWRTEHKRISTRVNLDNKGIDLQSICDEQIETEKTFFIKCLVAKPTWREWWKIQNVHSENLHCVRSMTFLNLPFRIFGCLEMGMLLRSKNQNKTSFSMMSNNSLIIGFQMDVEDLVLVG